MNDLAGPQRFRLILLAAMAVTVTCDQAAKAGARAFLSSVHAISCLGGILELRMVRNAGAFLSLGARMPDSARFLLFTLIGGLVVLAGMAYLLLRPEGRLVQGLAGAVALGGATGNLIDRCLHHGFVTDFLYLSAGPLHTGIFNVADMAVLFGAGWYILAGGPALRAEKAPLSDRV